MASGNPTNEEAWLESVLPETFTVFGLRLQPLSLGHMVLFRRLQNGFFCDAIETGWADLIQAIFLCSLTYQQAIKLLDSPKLARMIRRFGRACPKDRTIERIQLFREYIEAHTRVPHLVGKKGSGSAGAPDLLRIKVVLQSKLGYSEAEALSKPYGAALFEFVTYFENEGGCEMASNSDYDRWSALEAAKREYEEHGTINGVKVQGGRFS